MGSIGALGSMLGGVVTTAADIYKAKTAADAARELAEYERQERERSRIFALEERKTLLVSAGVFLVGGLIAYRLVKKGLA